ncbi:MAG: RNase adapter RapZ [Eubacteriales bacterium]
MDVVIVTGLSGAGKTQAVNCMEDMGYYCIDNMPPALIKNFIELSLQDKITIEKAAFVVDIRGGEFFDDFKASLLDLNKEAVNFKVLFLEASDEVLIRRFKEVRRAHPLSGSSSILEGITMEREKLTEIRSIADYIIDTSNMKSADLKSEISKLLTSERESLKVTISIMSFGYKNGIPLDADLVFDVRFLPNPFYLSSMKRLTGNSKRVKSYVMKFKESSVFIDMVDKMVGYLIPLYVREGKSHLVIAFGCTGGQHRSVVMANLLTEMLKKDDYSIIQIHRDL